MNNLLELFDINSLHPKDTLLFILYEMNVLSTDFDSIRLLKKKYPKSKFVLFFSNVIGTVRPKETKLLIDNRNLFDLIYTFSPNDALKYDLRLFFGGAFPYDPIQISRDEKYKSDIFWIGTNKGRYDYLVDISRKLKRNGVNVKFLITKENGDYDTSDVEVISEYLSYTEYLKYLYNSDCILDLASLGGGTIRMTEMIAYDKLMATNNPAILQSELYDPSQVMFFNDVSDELVKFIKQNRHKHIPVEKVSTRAFIDEVCLLLNIY